MFIQTRGPLTACMLNDYVLKKCLLGIWGPPGARGPGARAPMAPLLIRHWPESINFWFSTTSCRVGSDIHLSCFYCKTYNSGRSSVRSTMTSWNAPSSHYMPVRALRSSCNGILLKVTVPRKTIGQSSFSVAGPQMWNNLPIDVRSAQSLMMYFIIIIIIIYS